MARKALPRGPRRQICQKVDRANYDLVEANLARLGFDTMTDYLDYCLSQTVRSIKESSPDADKNQA